MQMTSEPYSTTDFDMFANAFGPILAPTSSQTLENYAYSADLGTAHRLPLSTAASGNLAVTCPPFTTPEPAHQYHHQRIEVHEADNNLECVIEPSKELREKISGWRPNLSGNVDGGPIVPVTISKQHALHAPQNVEPCSFPFRLEDNPELFVFKYSGTGDLGAEVCAFVEDNDLDLDTAIPLQMMVDAWLGNRHSTKWGFTWQHRKDDHVHATSRASAEGNETPPGSSTHGAMLDLKHRSSSHDIHYDHSTRTLRCKIKRVFPESAELQERFGSLSENWRKVDVSATLGEYTKLALQTALSEEALLAYMAGKNASATLVTLAQMLHVNKSECQCNFDDVFEEEAYQLGVRKLLVNIFPPSDENKPQLYRLRTRGAFDVLETMIEMFGIPVDQVLLYLQRDERARNAAICLTSSVDRIRDNSHDSFMGRWAWEGMVSKLIPSSSSLSTAFISRPGNPGPRSPTTDLDGRSKVRSADTAAPLRNAKARAPGRGTRKRAANVHYDDSRNPVDDILAEEGGDRSVARPQKKQKATQCQASNSENGGQLAVYGMAESGEGERVETRGENLESQKPESSQPDA